MEVAVSVLVMVLLVMTTVVARVVAVLVAVMGSPRSSVMRSLGSVTVVVIMPEGRGRRERRGRRAHG